MTDFKSLFPNYDTLDAITMEAEQVGNEEALDNLTIDLSEMTLFDEQNSLMVRI